MTDDTFARRTEVRISRRIAAAPALVFEAFTIPDRMKQWMWGSMSKEVWAEVNLRVGGAYRVYTRCTGGRHQGEGWSGMCGVYIEIVPDQKLVYTQHWDADVGYNQGDVLTLDEAIIVTFTPDGDGTQLEFTQLGVPDDGQSASAHKAGVSETLDVLEKLLAN